ncbi:hypothetical protein [Alicyclobacillus dauci]|uniref:Uncharacterized protein n=1 Tax=Alicyclobacillus dauci TaxID=1475485 RepID=A0ABY6Z8E9_9BACL|nr:hypothetical protein [Alicyclobacillus dauci]WAH38983.1 hypothetical protein NZD86_11125 [Alicyclobacillus dauci]
MVESLCRSFEHDIHAARGVTVTANHVVMDMYAGQQFTYSLNGAHQVIRVQRGGGVAVVSAGLNEFAAVANGKLVRVHATLEDGTTADFDGQVGILGSDDTT